MTPEERLLMVILDEIKSVKESQSKFQDEVRKDLSEIRKELHEGERALDRIKAKLAMIATVAAIIAAGVMQWVGNFFFQQ